MFSVSPCSRALKIEVQCLVCIFFLSCPVSSSAPKTCPLSSLKLCHNQWFTRLEDLFSLEWLNFSNSGSKILSFFKLSSLLGSFRHRCGWVEETTPCCFKCLWLPLPGCYPFVLSLWVWSSHTHRMGSCVVTATLEGFGSKRNIMFTLKMVTRGQWTWVLGPHFEH